MTAEIEIRDERATDAAAIRALNKLAFRQELEAEIVDALRSHHAALLSLVAYLDDRIVGHILYSSASIDDRIHGAALGPMAVHPEYQHRGIGSRLVEAGNRRTREWNWPFIIVLGHAGFYSRFGFRPASIQGIRCEWDVPDEVFMALILDEANMRGVTGLARYRPEFSQVIE